ncbi:MAG: hypothetical protein WCA97_19190, partial [Terriglobales bacterium]
MTRSSHQLGPIQERVKFEDAGIVRGNINLHAVFEYSVDMLVPKIESDVGSGCIKSELFRETKFARFLPT